MGYVVVENFAGGVDRTRPIYASNTGTLWTGINGHLTRGGDFEKRKAFVLDFAIPNETVLSGWLTFYDEANNPIPYSPIQDIFISKVCGSAGSDNEIIVYLNTPLTNMTPPAGYKYVVIRHPSYEFLSSLPSSYEGAIPLARRLLSSDIFDGKIYALFEFDDGTTIPYYDGAVVKDAVDVIDYVGFEQINNPNLGYVGTTILERLNSRGSAYNLTYVGYDSNGTRYRIATTDSNPINVTVFKANIDGTNKTTISFSSGSNGQVDFYVQDDFDILPKRSFAYSFTAIKLFIDTSAGLGDRMVQPAQLVKTYKRKMYSLSNSLLNFSGLDDPTKLDRDNDVGAGFINMSSQASGSSQLTAIEPYQDKVAIFARRTIQIWFLDTDESKNINTQILNDTGSRAGRSVVGYGDLDLFYLSDTGIRSIRARDTTNSASVNDVGTPIDTLVQEYLRTLTEEQIVNSVAIVEPTDGRYMLAIGSRIFVFSYFPSKRISAWSYYEAGFEIQDFFSIGDRIYARSGFNIYLLGGANNNTYGNDYLVTAQLPFLTAGKVATRKQFKGVDIGATGAWTMSFLTNPKNESEKVNCGTLDGITYSEDNIGALGHFTHVAPLLTHQGDGYASISNVTVHFSGSNDE